MLGFDYVGCEIDAGFFDKGVQRRDPHERRKSGKTIISI